MAGAQNLTYLMCEKVWHWNVTSFDLLILVYVWNFNSLEKIVLKRRSVFFQYSICTKMTALNLCLVCNTQDTATWCKWDLVPTCLGSGLTSLFVYVSCTAYQHCRHMRTCGPDSLSGVQGQWCVEDYIRLDIKMNIHFLMKKQTGSKRGFGSMEIFLFIFNMYNLFQTTRSWEERKTIFEQPNLKSSCYKWIKYLSISKSKS